MTKMTPQEKIEFAKKLLLEAVHEAKSEIKDMNWFVVLQKNDDPEMHKVPGLSAAKAFIKHPGFVQCSTDLDGVVITIDPDNFWSIHLTLYPSQY
jgi:hypothetical protein